MAEKILNTRVLQKTDSANNWKTNNPVLKAGEIGYESDTHKVKIGNGSDHWVDLVYTDANTLGGHDSSYFATQEALNKKLNNFGENICGQGFRLSSADIPLSEAGTTTELLMTTISDGSLITQHRRLTPENHLDTSIALTSYDNHDGLAIVKTLDNDSFTYSFPDASGEFALSSGIYPNIDAGKLSGNTKQQIIDNARSGLATTSDIPTITLNGTATKTPNFYAPIDEGEVKTRFNISLKTFPSQAGYYPLCTLPHGATGYSSCIISGRVGGWVANEADYVQCLITNRQGIGFQVINIRGGNRNSTAYNNYTNIVVYQEDNESQDATVYIKCQGYALFNINISLYQKSCKVLWNGQTTEPTGTEKISLFTTKNILKLEDGKAYVADSQIATLADISVIEGPQGPAGPQGDKGEQGIPGEPGANGLSIGSVTGSLISGDEAKSTYTVKLTDGSTVGTFQVQNGSKGSTGPAGAAGAKGDKGDTGSVAGTKPGTNTGNFVTSISLDDNTKELIYNKELEAALKSDLNNYYDSKTIDGKIDKLNESITAIPKFAIEVVTSLPTENISDTTVYLVKDTSNTKESENLYVEWIHVNGIWEKLGEQKVDLTGYATEKWVTDKNYLTTIPAEYITENELSTTLGSYVTDTELANKKYITNTKDAFDYSNLKGIPTDIATKDWVKTSVKVHDSDFLDGHDSTYFLNTSQGYATKSWVQTTARAHQAEDINFVTSQTGIPTAAYSLWPSARANRLSFLPADHILIEQSTDGGKTWTDADYSDSTKTGIFSQTRPAIYIPLKNGKKSCDCMLRLTITAINFKNVPEGTNAEKFAAWAKGHTNENGKWVSDNYVSGERYCTLDGMFLWLSSNSDRIHCIIEKSSGKTANNWIVEREAFCSGWSGADFIKLTEGNFGGGSNQTDNYWFRRITFRTCTSNQDHRFEDSYLSASYQDNRQSISEITVYGANVWTPANDLMNTDRLYHWDSNKTAFFPAAIMATEFIEGGTVLGNKYSYAWHTHTFTGTQATLSASYKPEGTISKPTITVTPSNVTITEVLDKGTLPTMTSTYDEATQTVSLVFNQGALVSTTDTNVVSDVTAISSEPVFTGKAATITTSYTPSGTISKGVNG